MLRWLAIAVVAAGLAAGNAAQAAGGLKVVVIIDNSGSMNTPMPGGGTRIDAAKQALLTVLGQTPADAEIGVVLLNRTRSGRWLVPLGPVDQLSVTQAVNSLQANGPTPLGAAMKVAADQLLTTRESKRFGTYKLLIVTDGEATDAGLLKRYLPEVQARGLLIDVIGVSMGNRHSLATQSNTYRRADDPASLQQAVSAVVLGESVADGAAADESDFELLQAIPGEIATAALGALTTRRNTPINARAANNRGASTINPIKPPAPVAVTPQPQRDSSLPFIIIIAAVFIVLRVIRGVIKSK